MLFSMSLTDFVLVFELVFIQLQYRCCCKGADELKLQEEKLTEKLEYQRQFEDEAKQMALSKETTNEAAPEEL
ncbi:hypothetical protein RHMOL_Rhmol13G0233400 [Rhododendron molle]|uniref:Uncharacterized protein n=1 Tax=Rhododendron molle TaxID=49168 RepID=A0ACC0L9N3_RHOML|nr:hypothetical protein RHMOL_Rhmol13G0233400 [Rhododendron molle]